MDNGKVTAAKEARSKFTCVGSLFSKITVTVTAEGARRRAAAEAKSALRREPLRWGLQQQARLSYWR
ncbi:MAG: hypothetical protein ACLRTQ_01005 [Candidatus Borkfalkia sp.]